MLTAVQLLILCTLEYADFKNQLVHFFQEKKDMDAECSSAAEAEIGIDESQKTNGG